MISNNDTLELKLSGRQALVLRKLITAALTHQSITATGPEDSILTVVGNMIDKKLTDRTLKKGPSHYDEPISQGNSLVNRVKLPSRCNVVLANYEVEYCHLPSGLGIPDVHIEGVYQASSPEEAIELCIEDRYSDRYSGDIRKYLRAKRID